jgi:Na+/phosphate symporter
MVRMGRWPAPLPGLTYVGMLISWVVLLIAVVGLVLYVMPGNGQRQEIGRLMFACGLLALCFALAGRTVRLL